MRSLFRPERTREASELLSSLIDDSAADDHKPQIDRGDLSYTLHYYPCF
jgi:hypothetical protein